jgi:hypothetical protein
MLVSLKHNFVLVAMPKCASSALETALAQHADLRIGGALKHAPFKLFEAYIMPFMAKQRPKMPGCEPFSLFREPLEWLFSWYSYRTRSELRAANDGSGKVYTGNISFCDFLNEHFAKKPAPFARVRPQSYFIEDGSGRFNAVTLYRYDEIDFMIRELARKIGRDVKLRREKISPARPLALSESQVSEARRTLKVEYQIYSSIPRRTAVDAA